MVSSFVMLRAAMMFAVLLTLNTVNVVGGQSDCKDDRDCSSSQYCYELSFICVNFTQCINNNRAEGPEPARQPSQCGECLPGYAAEKYVSGEIEHLCREIKDLKESEKAPVNEDTLVGIYIGCGVVVFVGIIIAITVVVIKMNDCTVFKLSATGQFFEKVNFLAARPTAPPQDDALNHLRSPYPEEEQPPQYSTVIGPSVDKDHLVSTVPMTPPEWVTKPTYEPPDHNHNVADGVAFPIHNSSVNLQMEMDEEADTIPSPWSPEPLTVQVPAEPFAIFANREQHDNSQNNALVRGNYSSNFHDGSGSDDSSEGPEEASGSRMRGGNYCGPNVQINQTITLNIARNGTK